MPTARSRHGRGIAAKVFVDLALPLPLQPGHEIEPDILGRHHTNCVEVTSDEPVAVGGEPRTRRVGELWQGCILTLARELSQPEAASPRAT